MATDIRSLPAFLNSDATFRTWVVGIRAQLEACGLVRTADTGQINPATVLRPAANTSAGYDIFRFADALQATAPIFIRVEYAVAGAQDRPRLNVGVGTGTNGAGTLSGVFKTPQPIHPSASKVLGDNLNSYCSGNGSRIALCANLDPASPNFCQFFAVERTKDDAGADTGIGVMFWRGSSLNKFSQFIPGAGVLPTEMDQFQLPVPLVIVGLTGAPLMADPLWVVGGDVAFLPTLAVWGKLLDPFTAALVYRHADIGELSTIAIATYGVNRTYMPLGDGAPVIAGSAIAILWE